MLSSATTIKASLFSTLHCREAAPDILHALSKITHHHGTTDTTKQIKNLVSSPCLGQPPIQGASSMERHVNHGNEYISMITSSS